MAYEVITHGGGEGLVYTFNAVAALFQGKQSFAGALVYIGGSFATAMAVITLVMKQELVPTAKWFFGSLIMMTALMLPKVDIIVKDRVSRLEQPVANVPFMLGAFAGIASQLGDIIAEKFDSLFARAGGEVMHYRYHGVAMASQLAAKATGFTIPNPDAAANVKAFVQNCMVFDIAKGKYSLNELLTAPDTWEFLKKHASPIRGFPYRAGKSNTRIVTCQESVAHDEAGWKIYVNEAAKRYGPELFPHSARPALELLSNLEISYQYLTGLSIDAATILKQNMMRNAMIDGLLELNQMHDASSAITAYAVSRAQEQQKTAYALQGNMASLSLSTLKIVIEVLFYGMFPMIVAIAVFPSGLAIVKKYLIALFWIQSWAPMYSILNMLVNVYGKVKSLAAVTLADGSVKTLAFATIPRLGEANEWVSAVAGYAMMSIPFLSYGIIHYGAGALSQLATHFGSVTQSSASHAAEEATTGNYHVGNTSFDNHNRNNVNAFKYDTNTAIAAGKSSVQNLDGSMLHRMANQDKVLDKKPTISELGASFSESTGVSTGLNKMAEHSHREGISHLQSSQESLSSALSRYQAIAEQYRSDENLTHAWAQGESVMKDSAFSTLDSASKELADTLNIDVSAANKLMFDGKLGIGAKLGIGLGSFAGKAASMIPVPKDISMSANLGFSGIHEEATRNSEQQRAVESIHQKYDIQNLLKQAEHESKEGRYALTDSNGNQYDSGIRTHLDEGLSQQKMAQASFAREEAYRESAQFALNSGVESTQNLSQQVFNEQAEKHGINEAIQRLLTPEGVKQARQEFITEHSPELENQFNQQKVYVDPNKLEERYQADAEQIKSLNNLNYEYENNTKNITEMAYQKDLQGKIQTNIVDKVDSELKDTGQTIQTKQQEFDRQKSKMEQSYQGFSQENKVNDYSKKVKNLFKGKGIEKPENPNNE